MRRAPIVISATVAGAAGVLGFHPRAPTVPATAAATPASNSSSSSGSGSGSGDGTATGDAVSTIYGAAQVRVTVKGGKIVKVEALQLQGNEPRSVQISSAAAPVLQQEVLAKQTADVDAVAVCTAGV